MPDTLQIQLESYSQKVIAEDKQSTSIFVQIGSTQKASLVAYSPLNATELELYLFEHLSVAPKKLGELSGASKLLSIRRSSHLWKVFEDRKDSANIQLFPFSEICRAPGISQLEREILSSLESYTFVVDRSMNGQIFLVETEQLSETQLPKNIYSVLDLQQKSFDWCFTRSQDWSDDNSINTCRHRLLQSENWTQDNFSSYTTYFQLFPKLEDSFRDLWHVQSDESYLQLLSEIQIDDVLRLLFTDFTTELSSLDNPSRIRSEALQKILTLSIAFLPNEKAVEIIDAIWQKYPDEFFDFSFIYDGRALKGEERHQLESRADYAELAKQKSEAVKQAFADRTQIFCSLVPSKPSGSYSYHGYVPPSEESVKQYLEHPNHPDRRTPNFDSFEECILLMKTSAVLDDHLSFRDAYEIVKSSAEKKAKRRL